MIKVVIVDDDRIVIEILKRMIRHNFNDIEIVGDAGDVKSAIDLIKEKKPELVFLDVEMPGGTGFSVLRNLDSINFEVVFITASDEYAISALRVNALDYLLKPIQKNELIDAINKFIKSYKKNKFLWQSMSVDLNGDEYPVFISLPSLNDSQIVRTNIIVRCKADSYYTSIFLSNGKNIMVSKTLKEYEKILSNAGFLRIHNSHLVNLSFVESFNQSDSFVTMLDGEKIPVSRRKKEKLIEFLNLHIS